MNDRRRYSPPFERNRDPIFEVLRGLWEDRSARILELGSGPGQHIVDFARRLPNATFVPSDREQRLLESPQAWAESEKVPNVDRGIVIDVNTPPAHLETERFDGVFTINVLHMIGPDEVASAIALAGRVLHAGGQFAVYDCFTYKGAHVAPSNGRFDQHLRASTAAGRVHAFEDVDAAARQAGFAPEPAIHWLPVNNQCVVWTRNP